MEHELDRREGISDQRMYYSLPQGFPNVLPMGLLSSIHIIAVMLESVSDISLSAPVLDSLASQRPAY